MAVPASCHASASPQQAKIHRRGLREIMEVHPLTLLTLVYSDHSPHNTDQLVAQLCQQIEAVLSQHNAL